METAPARVFSPQEWKVFLDGYQGEIELDEQEKSGWQQILNYVYVDEVVWAIVNLEESESDRQKSYIQSLIGLNLLGYCL